MKKVLANLLFFFSLMPFISPYPIGTDVQPISLMLGTILLIWRFFEKRLPLDYFAICFILIAIFSILYGGFDPENNFEARHRFGLIFAFITFIAIYYYFDLFSPKVLMAAIFLNFMGIIWHSLSPGTFEPFAELIVRTIKVHAPGRGVTGFAAETSFNSITALVQLIITFFFYNNKKISLSFFLTSLFFCMTVILLTSSGTGYLLTLLVFGTFFLYKLSLRSIFTILIILPIFTVGFLNSNLSDTRGGLLLKTVLTNPSILLLDGSVSERLLALEIGFRALQMNPLGYGGGSYEKVARKADEKYSLVYKYENLGICCGRGKNYLKETISSFSRYSIELGIFFTFFLIFIVYKCASLNLYNMLAIPLAVVLILVSFSILFPPTYLLLITSIYQKKYNLEKV
tara:strand:+ start:1689 stop:2888 length:1200 start_codon:yes stop_codon:yes gene_type:complete